MARPPRRPAVSRDARTFYRLATVVLAVGVLYVGKVIFVPVALAVLFAFALSPIANWLERHGLGRVLSSLAVTLLALGVVGAVGGLAIHQGERMAAELPKYEDNVRKKAEPLLAWVRRVEQLEDRVTPTPEPRAAGTPAKPTDPPAPVVVKTPGAGALGWLPSLAQPVAEVAGTTLLVTVLSLFMLVQREKSRARLVGLAGRRSKANAANAVADASRRVSHYLLLQAGTNAAIGLVTGVGLVLIGVPYAPLWGVLTACLRFIPYVGIWASAFFPFAVAVAEFDGWWTAGLVLALYAAADLSMTNLIEPMLFGHGTGVSALALLVAAVFWGWLWGPVGLLLAVPLTVCLAVIGEHVPSFRFLHTLLTDSPEPVGSSVPLAM